MKQRVFRLLTGVATAITVLTVYGKNVDCSVARDPRRCAAKQVASEACHDLQGQARSACMRDVVPPPDCTHAPNTSECQSKLAVEAACKNKRGKVNRGCVNKQTTTR